MKQEKSFFEIMDCVVELSKHECQTYNELIQNLYTKAPIELKEKIATATKGEFIDAMSDLIIEIDLKLDVPNLISSMKGQALPTVPTATFNVLGHEIELTADECKSYEAVCDALFENAPIALSKKLNRLSDEDLVEAVSDLLVQIEAKLDSPLK